MKRILTVFLAFAIISAAAPATLLAQEAAAARWAAVKSTSVGVKLSVKLKSGETASGRLSEVTDTSLTLSGGGKTKTFGRDEIQKIYSVSGSSRGKYALIGLGVGAGVGMGAGAAASQGPAEGGEKYLPVAQLGLAGGGLGALVGALLGSGKRKQLIYEAP